MKRYLLAAIAGTALLLLAVLGIYFTRPPSDGQPAEDASPLAVVDVDQIVKHPDRFGGAVSVSGKVVKVDESGTAFALGCDDACVTMLVKYEGSMPDLGGEVIVRGQLKLTDEGRHFFEGRAVEGR